MTTVIKAQLSATAAGNATLTTLLPAAVTTSAALEALGAEKGRRVR